MTGLWIALCMTALTYGAWHARGLLLEDREQAVRFERRAAQHDRLAAQAIRAQAEDMLIDAEYDLTLIRACTEDTQVLPTIRVRVDGVLKSLKDYAHHVFGDDDHEGWTEESWAAAQRELVSRRNWPMRHRPTPLDMPDPLEPTEELLIRIHHREGLVTA